MKLNTVKLVLLALGVFSFSSSLIAQEIKKPDVEKMMKRFDTDKNGSISLKEFISVKRKNEVPADRLGKRFNQMDKDENGAVTLKELKAFFEKSKGKKKGKKK